MNSALISASTQPKVMRYGLIPNPSRIPNASPTGEKITEQTWVSRSLLFGKGLPPSCHLSGPPLLGQSFRAAFYLSYFFVSKTNIDLCLPFGGRSVGRPVDDLSFAGCALLGLLVKMSAEKYFVWE